MNYSKKIIVSAVLLIACAPVVANSSMARLKTYAVTAAKQHAGKLSLGIAALAGAYLWNRGAVIEQYDTATSCLNAAASRLRKFYADHTMAFPQDGQVEGKRSAEAQELQEQQQKLLQEFTNHYEVFNVRTKQWRAAARARFGNILSAEARETATLIQNIECARMVALRPFFLATGSN